MIRLSSGKSWEIPSVWRRLATGATGGAMTGVTARVGLAVPEALDAGDTRLSDCVHEISSSPVVNRGLLGEAGVVPGNGQLSPSRGASMSEAGLLVQQVEVETGTISR